MAAASQTIRQQIWEGRLPLQINLSRAECRVFDKAEPYIVNTYSSRFLSCVFHVADRNHRYHSPVYRICHFYYLGCLIFSSLILLNPSPYTHIKAGSRLKEFR